MSFEHYCACIVPIICIVLDYLLSFEYSVFWNGCYDLNFNDHILGDELSNLIVVPYLGVTLKLQSLAYFILRSIFEFFDNRKGSFFLLLGQLD